MFKRISTNNVLNYIVIGLLLAAVAIRGGASFQWLKPDEKPTYSMDEIKKVFPQANQIKVQSDQSLKVFNSEGQPLGYALVSDHFGVQHQGYGGNVPILLALDLNKQITGVVLLPNAETPEYIEHVVDKKLLEAWNGLPLDTMLVAMQVDAITGATFSSKAIIQTFRDTAANYIQIESQQTMFSAERVLQLLLMGLLLYFSLSMALGKRYRKYYWYYLFAVFFVMGLWLKKMLSMEQLHHWLVKGIPWQSQWELTAILSLSVAMAMMGYRQYYCNYLCPMGALQMLVSKISPFQKRSASIKISVVTLRTIYLSFIWISLLLGFALPLADMEPFGAFSFKVASAVMLVAGALIVVLSLFFNRPWCQFCPTGCLLDTVHPVLNPTNQSKE